MPGRKMYRTHRVEYVGARPTAQGLQVYVQNQAAQGPAGWVDQGPRTSLVVPWSTIVKDDNLPFLDRAVRRALIEHWSGVPLEEPLF